MFSFVGGLLRAMLVVTFAAAPAAYAQSLTTVVPGTRVRLSLDDSLRQGPLLPARQTITGRLLRATTDAVWLQPAGAASFSVSHDAIATAWASRGASRSRSAIASGIGLGLAAAAIQLTQQDHQDRALAMGGGGLGLGILIGAFRPYEQWRRLRK